MFGNWTKNLEQLNKEFLNSGSVKYVIINNFFTEEWADKIHNDFPLPHASSLPWRCYNDPIESRYTLNNFDETPDIKKAVVSIYDEEFIKNIEKITSIKDLIVDPNYQDGTGLQAIPREGKLSIHLDYSINKQSGKERRCNLLIYLNKNWKEEYGGNLQLGDSLETCKDITSPSWNTAIIFHSTPVSYHGIPKQVKCPDGEYRKSLGLYFSSDVREDSEIRYRGVFFPEYGLQVSKQLQNLYALRNTRILTPEDWNHISNFS